MRLSPLTREILHNLSTVAADEKCCPLVVYPGNKLQAVAASSNIVAYAEVEEMFPHFAIYDLRSFIAALSIFKDPDIQFDRRVITITEADGGEVMRFPGCDLNSIKHPHDAMTPEEIAELFERVEDPEEGERLEFELSWSKIQNAQKAASALAALDKDFYYVINSEKSGIIRFGCADGKGTRNKTYFAEVGESPVTNFTIFAKRDAFAKLLDRDYKVIAREQLILMKSNNITYFVAAAVIGDG